MYQNNMAKQTLNDLVFAEFCKTTGYNVDQIGNIKLDIIKKTSDYQRLRTIITDFLFSSKIYSRFADKMKYPFLQDKTAISDLLQSFVEYYNEHGTGHLELTPDGMTDVCKAFDDYDVVNEAEDFGNPNKFGNGGSRSAIFTVREIFDVLMMDYRCALVDEGNRSSYKTAKPLVEYMFKLFGYGKSSLRGAEAQAIGIFLRKWNDIREMNPESTTFYDILGVFNSTKTINSKLFQVYQGILNIHNNLIISPNKNIQTMINRAFIEFVQKLVVKY